MAPFALTALAAGALAKLASPTMGLLGLGAGVAFLLLRRTPSHGPFVLRVDDGVLEVTRRRASAPGARIRLADLVDVTIDRQVLPASGRGGAAAERARLALEMRDPSAPIFVPDDRITAIEAQEWYGKVRVFLRKHGWVPDDERVHEDAGGQGTSEDDRPPAVSAQGRPTR